MVADFTSISFANLIVRSICEATTIRGRLCGPNNGRRKVVTPTDREDGGGIWGSDSLQLPKLILFYA